MMIVSIPIADNNQMLVVFFLTSVKGTYNPQQFVILCLYVWQDWETS